MEKRYMISDAAKMVEVESHVLRYWEEELKIDIPRNEMDHRYYTEKHINMFKEIKELKEQGFLLKAIKMLLPELMGGKTATQMTSHSYSATPLNDLSLINEDKPISSDTIQVSNATAKMEQFQNILGNIVSKALEDNNNTLGKQVSSQVSDSVIKEMDYLLRLREEHEEERFKKLDETIRNYQKAKKEIATTSEKKKKRFWK